MTKNKPFDPFKNLVLDDYEQEIEDGINRGEYVSILTPKLKKKFQQAADNTLKHLKKNKSISIRISEQDLTKLKHKAAKAGLPYQTLITSVLHRYAHDSNITI